MKYHRHLPIIACGLLLTSGLLLQAATSDDETDRTGFRPRFQYDRSQEQVFRDQECSLDLFGTYASRDRLGNSADRWGGGAGVNFFFLRYVGISADSYLEEWRVPYRVNGSVILRFPLDNLHLSPYVFGGAGRELKHLPQWTAHAGAGAEFRLNASTGFFADIRRVIPDKSGDYTLVRAGVRLAF